MIAGTIARVSPREGRAQDKDLLQVPLIQLFPPVRVFKRVECKGIFEVVTHHTSGGGTAAPYGAQQGI